MMTPIERIDIHLLYRDPARWHWTLHALARGDGYIDPSDMEAAAFVGAAGGIRLLAERIFCFLDTEAAGDLLSYVDFLLTSIAGLADGEMAAKLERFRHGAGEPDVVARLTQEDRSCLEVRSVGPALCLNFLDPEGDAPPTRGSPYFRDLLIARVAWRDAAMTALDEYFTVAAARIRDTATGPGEVPPILQQLLAAWTSLPRSR